MTVQKPTPKQFLLVLTCDLLKAREKSRVRGATGFGFACHSLKNWHKIYEAITGRSTCNRAIGLLQLTITWYKSAMLEGKLIIIPALGHQNKGKSSFTGSGLFVLMSQCGNNNELALQHGGFCTTWSLVAKGLLVSTVIWKLPYRPLS